MIHDLGERASAKDREGDFSASEINFRFWSTWKITVHAEVCVLPLIGMVGNLGENLERKIH